MKMTHQLSKKTQSFCRVHSADLRQNSVDSIKRPGGSPLLTQSGLGKWSITLNDFRAKPLAFSPEGHRRADCFHRSWLSLAGVFREPLVVIPLHRNPGHSDSLHSVHAMGVLRPAEDGG